jgi:hypothetical protein
MPEVALCHKLVARGRFELRGGVGDLGEICLVEAREERNRREAGEFHHQNVTGACGRKASKRETDGDEVVSRRRDLGAAKA